MNVYRQVFFRDVKVINHRHYIHWNKWPIIQPFKFEIKHRQFWYRLKRIQRIHVFLIKIPLGLDFLVFDQFRQNSLIINRLDFFWNKRFQDIHIDEFDLSPMGWVKAEHTLLNIADIASVRIRLEII